MSSFRLSSSSFFNGSPIPVRFTGDGDDVSPALSWNGQPYETNSFSLVCSDPDAPNGTWYHWAMWNIPHEAAGLPEGMPKTPVIEMGAGSMVQGTNDFKNPGYGGPMPPEGHGLHHYHFTLTALSVPSLPIGAGADCREVEKAAAEHALAVAQWMGTYER